MDQDRLGDLVLGFELGQQLVEIVDVPRPLDLGQHHNVELVAGFGDQRGDVIQRPRRVEAVDARPQAGCAEIELLGHRDEAGAGLVLFAGGDRVFQVAEHDVDLADGVLELGPDLGVMRRDEVDHPLKLDRHLPIGLRRANREGREEFGRRARGGHGSARGIVSVKVVMKRLTGGSRALSTWA